MIHFTENINIKTNGALYLSGRPFISQRSICFSCFFKEIWLSITFLKSYPFRF